MTKRWSKLTVLVTVLAMVLAACSSSTSDTTVDATTGASVQHPNEFYSWTSIRDRAAPATTLSFDHSGLLPMIRGDKQPVKVLGDGKLTKKLTVQVHKFSASAQAGITKAGGSCEVVTS